MPARTLGPEGGWIVMSHIGLFGGPSHIDWRKEQVPARTLDPEGRWIVMSHSGWRGEQNTLYKGVKTFP